MNNFFMICSWIVQNLFAFWTCSKPVHNIFTIFSQLVHDSLMPCSWLVHSFIIIYAQLIDNCSALVYNFFTFFNTSSWLAHFRINSSQFVYDLSKTYSHFVHDLFMELLVHNLFMMCSNLLKYMFINCLQLVQFLLVICSWLVYDSFIICQYFFILLLFHELFKSR